MGRARSQGSSVNTKEMWLPSTSLGQRTLTGTIAFSAIGCSPWRIR